ncbi:hypothetical protein DN069_15910 [Streptacidiphilus pinicola]|uniref:Heavy metal transporter n=1 Tax=Streptacidiphilus pinicola TaxID=2219663 RepID=A0A2X0K5T6_9ACTN|nr:hypothetical protein [Streptacidiphilus pinicola]RAG84655.1 hypothetical protein DN069_15910 [Streptacidiphilus pinicola]
MSLSEMMGAGDDTPTPRRRRRRWLGCLPVLVLLVVAAVVVGLLIAKGRNFLPGPISEGCEVDTTDGIVPLSLDQMQNASTIAAVATARNLPERAVQISLATAMQESRLTNLSGGDRDSIGLFQQRPSQGWGSPQQIADPVYATNKFLDKLVAIPGYAQLPLTEAAQDVQHSGFPDAYAQHEADAMTLSSALTGRVPAAMNCTVDGVGTSPSGSGGTTLQAELKKDFGRVVSTTDLGASTDSGGSSSSSSSASPQHLLSVAVHGSAYVSERGWAVAQWSVAHAKSLHITEVDYAGKTWNSSASDKGWVSTSSASPGTTAASSDSTSGLRITVA